MLNKALNNNDVMHVVIIVQNEAPNCDATHVANNERLTTKDTQFSIVAISPSCRKADLPEIRNNDTITRKVHADRNKLFPGKEWQLYAQ